MISTSGIKYWNTNFAKGIFLEVQLKNSNCKLIFSKSNFYSENLFPRYTYSFPISSTLNLLLKMFNLKKLKFSQCGEYCFLWINQQHYWLRYTFSCDIQQHIVYTIILIKRNSKNCFFNKRYNFFPLCEIWRWSSHIVSSSSPSGFSLSNYPTWHFKNAKVSIFISECI